MKYFLFCILFMMMTSNMYAKKETIDSLKSTPDSIASWQYEIQAYYYILPNENNNTILIGYTDFKALHLEGRYNYENINTGSIFFGYNLNAGNIFTLAATPMIGFIAGKTKGIAPGLEFTLNYKILDFYSESEYVFDTEGNENDFFYNWTELAIIPVQNFRTGISANRTHLFESELEIQKGIFAEYSYNKTTAGVHYFNPFSNNYFIITTLSVAF